MVRRGVSVDYPLVLLALGLSFAGIAAVYSAGQTDVSSNLANLWRMQALYLALGLGAAWMASRSVARRIHVPSRMTGKSSVRPSS